MENITQLHEKAQLILIKARCQKGKIEIYQKYQSTGEEYQMAKKQFNKLMLDYKKIINEIQILVYEKYV